MITSFKTSRKDLIDKNQLLKYLSYAFGEIVIVVIGILLAVYLNNLNEQKTNNALEIKHYRSLRDQLKEDMIVLSDVKAYNEKYYVQYCYAVKLIEDNARSKSDTLGKIALNMVKFSDFRRKSNAYQTLINSGEIVILKNKEITKGLQSLEEVYNYVNRLEENHSTINFSLIISDLKETIQFNPVKIIKPEILFSYKFTNDFNALIILMKEKQDAYDQAIDGIQGIIRLIDKELSE